MAGTNLVVKLLLESAQFDRTLKDSKGQIDGLDSATKAAGVSVLKYATGLGVAATAVGALGKIITATQTPYNTFRDATIAAQGSVDAFFYSISSGNWDVFKNGIISAYEELRELSAMMTALSDKEMSMGFIKSEEMRSIEEYESIAKDTTLSMKERQAAAEKMGTTISNLNKKTADHAKFLNETLTKKYSASYGIELERDDLDYFFRNTNFKDPQVLQAIDEYNQGLEGLKKQHESYVHLKKTISAEGQKEIETYTKQNKFIAIQAALHEEGNEGRKETLQMLQKQLGAEREIHTLRKRANMTTNRLNKQASKTEKEKPLEGTAAYLDEQIKKYKNQLQNIGGIATEEGIKAASAIQQKINELEAKKIYIELELKKPQNIREIDQYVQNEINTKTSNAQPPAKDLKQAAKLYTPTFVDSYELPKDNIVGSIEELQKKIQDVTLAYNNATTDGLRKIYAKQKKDYEDNLEGILNKDKVIDASEAFGMLSGAYQNVATSLAQVSGENERTAATAKKLMIASQGLAIAQGVAEAVKIGFPQNIPAIAATLAAVIGAWGNIQGFASGGIVGGSSFAGDKIPIRVNSGEMILNTMQQSRLFSMLDGGASNGSGSGGQVVFRIDGRTLVGVLDNFNKKQSRF